MDTSKSKSRDDTALSIPKAQRRPPALVLEENNQHVVVQAEQSEGTKVKHEYGMLRRLHNLLPTPAGTAYFTASSETPAPESAVPLRKIRSPRSASLPSIRWDKSPLSRRTTREGSLLTKVMTSEGAEPSNAPQTNVKGLKIRMITWNMHDSLPKGELEELLGKVLPYNPDPSHPPGAFPNLPEDPDHPYHFVVVAGQECPSVSRLPMAVGAGFKLREKDKDKERDENGRGPSFEKDSDTRSKDGNRSPDSAYLHKPTITTRHSMTSGADEPPRTPSPESLQIAIPNPPLAGWSSVVEDWLCNGGIFELPRGPKTPKIVEVVGNVVTGAVPGTPRLALKRAPSIKEPKKGPYQFLVKERLMGIYLAIYVHRDLKPLIKGTSKSAVTAGLVGGRVGNKGGVGISVNLGGTTLLFLNCHLAAHEGKMHHRLANLAKIKSELEVDDFLPKNDPRKKLDDLSDRFDFTFLCGDLNFRLDITRLHADWLISRQDYAQALTFDQLLKAMKDGSQEFNGFNEAPINFAPTFKYDVLRTLKRQKRGGENDFDDDDPDAEAGSISSVSTSFSRVTDLDLTNTAGYASPATPAVPSSSSKLSLSHVVSAHKAKIRLLSLKSPFSAMSSPSKTSRKTAGTGTAGENGGTYFTVPAVPVSPSNTAFPPTPKMIDHAVIVPPTPPATQLLLDSGVSAPLPLPPKVRVDSVNSGVGSGSQDNFDVGKGVYDTSNKKRVPSWCDRILWKTTVEPSASPNPDETHKQLLSPPPPKSTGIFGRLRTKSARASRPPPLAAPARRKSTEGGPTEFLPPLKTAPPLSQAMFTSTDEKVDGPSNAAPQNASSAGVVQGGFFQWRSVVSPPPTAPVERPRRPTGLGVLMSPLSGGSNANGENPGTSSRWRFLPNFLSPHSHSDAAVEEQVTPVVTPAIVHRRGDVVCLDYNTLDDRQMRRLEGRSDHRPVLGTFVVYI